MRSSCHYIVAVDRTSSQSLLSSSRLRQVDVKAEHFERQVQRLEQERDAWEKKYEVCLPWSPLLLYMLLMLSFLHLQAEREKLRKAQTELDELEASMQDL